MSLSTGARAGWTGPAATPRGELRAEIGACFLSAVLEIPDSGDLTNHTSYIAHWLQALENDPKFIFRASSAASKATDYILSFSKPQDAAQGEVEIEAEAVEVVG